MLTDLAEACRKSGLRVVELDGWRVRRSAGGEAYRGVLCHHTGSYDDIGDTDSDLSYALWMARTGRPDLDPPLCNLALSAEGVVYVAAAGNANHAGQAKASGPMPAASDGNALYIGIEAMNSGSQGWSRLGRDDRGKAVTQYDAYVRLCAALCKHYGWPASHVRAHRETSVTGKWDPGLLEMTSFRADVAREIRGDDDDMPAYSEWPEKDRKALADDVAKAVLDADMNAHEPKGDEDFRGVSLRQVVKRIARAVGKE